MVHPVTHLQKPEPSTRSPFIASSIRFIGDDVGLRRLVVRAPSIERLAPLFDTLSRCRVRVRSVHAARVNDQTTWALDVTENDGAVVSREKWMLVQSKILDSTLGQQITVPRGLRATPGCASPSPTRLDRSPQTSRAIG
jgi:hypothetical protein